jgi:molybdopterin synthase sulfur carrier subunit
MKVRIRAFASFRHILGKEIPIELPEKATVKELLDALCSRHSPLRSLLYDSGVLREDVNILINGKNITSLKGESSELAEGDELAIFPAAIGG